MHCILLHESHTGMLPNYDFKNVTIHYLQNNYKLRRSDKCSGVKVQYLSVYLSRKTSELCRFSFSTYRHTIHQSNPAQHTLLQGNKRLNGHLGTHTHTHLRP